MYTFLLSSIAAEKRYHQEEENLKVMIRNRYPRI